jgi:flavin reductase (DIM6/NTAB) family NADH-FMN oxidoreductase RutF
MTDRYAAITAMLPCPAVIVTAAAGERRDAMTATAFFVSEVPPLVSVSIATHHLTSELIQQTGEFVINVATPEQVELVRNLGSIHGREVDKFEKLGLGTLPSKIATAPRLAGSYVSLECRVVGSYPAATYRLYVAEILADAVDTDQAPLLWHRGHFFSMGAEVGST